MLRDQQSGFTPLHMAAHQQAIETARTNNAGQTPVGLARLIGNYDVAQYFEDVPEG